MRSPSTRVAPLLVAMAATVASAQDKAGPLPDDRRAALDRISADSLRGHLSFLASDLLEGRDTPSRGLDIAAEYIAAQFRRAGLEPAGDDGYFQTARWERLAPDESSFAFEVRSKGETLRVPAARVSLADSGALNLDGAAALRVDASDAKALEALTEDQVRGRAVVAEIPRPAGAAPLASRLARRALLARLATLKAAVVLLIDRDPNGGTGLGNGRLIDPENPSGGPRRNTAAPPIPVLTVHDPKAVALLEAAGGEATITLRLGEPVKLPAPVRNVVGLLRGSDPALKETYVLVTAHYDHVGIGAPVNGDRIYNGANDDGSGTVSVVEVASALASLKERPKRSLVFMTFFGEEKGLLGSRYYGKHPIFPIEATVADVNLEQVGRTDDTEGPKIASASMTGIDFSHVGQVFREAGEAEGVAIVKHPRNSDAYFGASDNQALADLGVPAHTLCVAFQYPDYHGALDHWDKVDYANMARIDRVVARALLMIADEPHPPLWSETNPKADRYRKAYEARHPR